ncbi:NAD(P)/FAD-dependent oxidoreductase [Marivita sp.]|uniref:dihydrolipoyl dehydrogenase family protein n=1 Tax=Marivita sp. TaxID=2003365 RepID=UPI0025BF7AFB|nr:NAD(P)/FAD-dependent oxidoreductase [Marivita sp.]
MTQHSISTSDTFDLVVIGGGSGGLAAAKRAASHGARVALIERDALGGTCVNRGCVPKKLMWLAARHQIQSAHLHEMEATQFTPLDYGMLHKRVTDHVALLKTMYEKQLSDAGIHLFRGTAEVYGPDDIRVGDAKLSAGKLLLATGARPKRLPIEGVELACVSDDVFHWNTLPKSLVVIGGGYIGCEFATIFNAFGVEVTLLNNTDRLLAQFAHCAGAMAQTHLESQNVNTVLGIRPERIVQQDHGLAVHLSDGAVLEAEKVLLATGRQPNVDKLGPVCARFETAKSGALTVDSKFRTSVPNIHSIGDSADRIPLTPVATRDGETFAEQHFGSGADPIDLTKVASTAFVYPPVAQVGTVPADADLIQGRNLGGDVTFPRDRICAGHSLHYDEDGALSGVALVHESAPEIIAVFGGLIHTPGSQPLLTAATGIHPSFAEELLGR